MACAESVVSIAVDFGTAYSGYCFKFRKSKQIRMPKWGLEIGYDTLKTPTCILFDENKQFLNFGYDAIETYNRHKSKEEAKRLYLFDNFKMEALMISAKNGKKMRAIKVFSESLKFMKDHALDKIREHTAGMEYSACEATWVLTVPAIWSPAAKQFMREAAVQAGLIRDFDHERLIVALEPEAASVWCKHYCAPDQNMNMTFSCFYLGGTIDITVHEVMEGGRLKELHKVSGNNMGGQTVDKNFREFLRKTLTEDVFDEFEEKYPTELYRLMCDFSVCKRSGSNGMGSQWCSMGQWINTTELNFRFYRTESKTVQYVDEEGVEEFGLIRVELPTAKKSREQSVRLKIKFGFTEMMATITDRKGNKTDAKLDFMTESLVL
uniref:Heat shock protein family A (Hsp70) member 12A.2 n=1 Tax=Astyanax mexicanus TaxID=7994 RepID=A0A3B1IE07_ASTMX